MLIVYGRILESSRIRGTYDGIMVVRRMAAANDAALADPPGLKRKHNDPLLAKVRCGVPVRSLPLLESNRLSSISKWIAIA